MTRVIFFRDLQILVFALEKVSFSGKVIQNGGCGYEFKSGPGNCPPVGLRRHLFRGGLQKQGEH
jgi:hypothetical protein